MVKTKRKINNPFVRKIISKVYYSVKRKNRDFLLKMMPKNSICAEIGVYKGDFSKSILQIVKPKKLVLIDKWMYIPHIDTENYAEILHQKFFDRLYTTVLKNFNDKPNVEIKKGDSCQILSEYPDEYFDWIYIDADHRYEGVKSDLNIAYTKLKAGGFIAGDDYVYDIKWKDGVIKAVDEFCQNHQVNLVTVRNYQYILEKK